MITLMLMQWAQIGYLYVVIGVISGPIYQLTRIRDSMPPIKSFNFIVFIVSYYFIFLFKRADWMPTEATVL